MIGIGLIVIGIGLLLDTFLGWDIGTILSIWWPLLIIIFGIYHLIKKQHSYLYDIFIILVGVLLQANELYLLPGGFWSAFWPLLIILIGISFIGSRKKWHHKTHIPDGDFNYSVTFAGRKEVLISDNLKSGQADVSIAGIDIDLRQCTLAEDGAVLDLSIFIGGITLRVPTNWRIIFSGTPFMGGIDNKTKQRYDQFLEGPILKINYSIMMGGIEISN